MASNLASITHSPETVWHYTTIRQITKILTEGVIRQATIGIPSTEKPICWFSTEQQWEPSVMKKFRGIDLDGLDGYVASGLMPCRIGVAPATAPFDWDQLRERSGMEPKIARSLAKIGKERGANPKRWRGTFRTVLETDWTDTQAFVDGLWTPIYLTRDGDIQILRLPPMVEAVSHYTTH